MELFFFTCVITNNVALLLDGDINHGHTTTLGPLGKDATLSLLVQEVLDLKARVKSQEQEIQTLKTQQATLGVLGQTSNQTSLLALQTRLDNMEQNVNNLMLNTARPCAINSNHVGNSFIRLVGGDDANSGRVEVMFHNEWGTICDDKFNNNIAKVVCRMLGKPTDNAVAFGEAYFGAGSGTIVFQDITCNGTEADLIHCRHTAMGYAHCNHNEDAGVRCA